MKLGFIGTGAIARAHATAIRRVDGVDLVSVFDRNEEILDKFSSDFEVPAASSAEQLFDEVDAVYVLTPPKAHRDPLLEAIAHGKHVLCEKPIAVDLDDASAMVAAAEKAGVVFGMGFNNRARPQIQALRNAVASGQLGDVISCWSRRLGYSRWAPDDWRTAEGALAGMTIQSISHDVDMLRYAVGEIELVAGVTGSSMPQVSGFDDNLSATLVFESGVVGNIHASWSSHLGHGSRGVIGSEGSFSIEGPGLWMMTHSRSSNVGGDAEQVEWFARDIAEDMGYAGTAAAFRDAVETGSAPLASGHDGLRSLEISSAILASSARREMVDSRGFRPE